MFRNIKLVGLTRLLGRIAGNSMAAYPSRHWWHITWPAWLWVLWLRQAWPVPSWFHGVPAGEDTWQAIAMLVWYSRTLHEGAGSPLFYPLVFAPQGLHTTSLHYGPFLIFLMLPWALLGGPAFAYNLLGWIALTIAFLGAYRLTYLFTRSSLAATAVGIAYALFSPAYFGMRAFGDHMNLAWGFAFCPLMLYELERSRRAGWRPTLLLRAGLWWGLGISGSFYTIPLNAPVFLIYGWLAFRNRALRKMLFQFAGIALLVSSPWTSAFLYTKYIDQLEGRPISWLYWTSTDWKEAVRWNPYHVIHDLMGQPAEASQPFIGQAVLVTSLLGIIISRIRRSRLASWPLLVIAGIATFLATGAFFRWGGPIHVPWPEWGQNLLNLLWQAGYRMKPSFLESPTFPQSWNNQLLSPAILLWIFLPYWEMVIFPYRYLGLLGLSIYITGAEAWVRNAGRFIQAGIFTLWILEAIHGPGKWIPWPPPSHPAFTWLRTQSRDGLIVDMVANPQVRIWSSGSILLAPLFHSWPTLSGFEAIDPLWSKWITTRYGPNLIASPERLRAIGVRYVLLHILSRDWREEIWPGDRLERIGCFDPPNQPSPWKHPICIYKIPSRGLDRITNVLLVQGWSGTEPWGLWAEGVEAEALWITSAAFPAHMELRAFPICSADRSQRMEIWINEIRIGEYRFSSCAEIYTDWKIPSSLVRQGTNRIRFRFAYALSPHTLTGGQNPDPRPLSVGFRRIWIVPER